MVGSRASKQLLQFQIIALSLADTSFPFPLICPGFLSLPELVGLQVRLPPPGCLAQQRYTACWVTRARRELVPIESSSFCGTT
jgi:hypothetical protein